MDSPCERLLDIAAESLDARAAWARLKSEGALPGLIKDVEQRIAVADSRFETAFREAMLHALRYDERLRKAAQQG